MNPIRPKHVFGTMWFLLVASFAYQHPRPALFVLCVFLVLALVIYGVVSILENSWTPWKDDGTVDDTE